MNVRKYSLVILFAIGSKFAFGQSESFSFNDTVFRVGSQVTIYGDLSCTDPFSHLCEYRLSNRLYFDSIGTLLKNNPTLHVLIQEFGSFDWDNSYCKEFTIQKAKMLQRHLIETFGLDSAQIRVQGMGQLNPIVNKESIDKLDSSSEKSKAHALNRRTVIIIAEP